MTLVSLALLALANEGKANSDKFNLKQRCSTHLKTKALEEVLTNDVLVRSKVMCLLGK